MLEFFLWFTRWMSGDERGESLFFGFLCVSLFRWLNAFVRIMERAREGDARSLSLLSALRRGNGAAPR